MNKLPRKVINKIADALLLATAMLCYGSYVEAASMPSGADPVRVRTVRCDLTEAFKAVECKQATLPENYDAPSGREIRLDVKVFKARQPGRIPKAVFFLQGGPGQRATLGADFYQHLWDSLRDTSDLVFVDQRGTGTTPDLHCSVEKDPVVLGRDLWPAASLTECGKKLSKVADLTRYTTSDAARDLNNVRKEMGYGKIDLIGYSYGTRLAQEYLRHYDHTVHAALLIGPESPLEAVPAGLAAEADVSIAKLLERCKSDTKCGRIFPDIEQDAKKLKSQWRSESAITQEERSNLAAALPSPGVAASFMRMMMYSMESAVEVPGMIHTLAAGDPTKAVNQSIMEWRREFAQAAPWGLYLSVTCAEDVPFVDVQNERIAAKDTFVGSYRIDQQVAACQDWPARLIPPEFHTVVATEVPVLLMVGEFDPATPSGKSAGIIGKMANGRLLVIPNRSHGMSESIETDWKHCLEPLAVQFLQSSLPLKELDATCVNHLSVPEF